MIAHRATRDVTKRTGLVPAKLLLAEQTAGITERLRQPLTCDAVPLMTTTSGMGVTAQVDGR